MGDVDIYGSVASLISSLHRWLFVTMFRLTETLDLIYTGENCLLINEKPHPFLFYFSSFFLHVSCRQTLSLKIGISVDQSYAIISICYLQ